MTERTLMIELDVPTLARIEAAAAAAGLSIEAWALDVLNAAVPMSGVRESSARFDSPHDWTEAERRLAEYDRTGESVPLEEALREFRQHVEAGLAAKA